MKDQFVTYEIALKLKELGFDEDCLYYFDSFKYVGSSSAFWDNYNKSDILISRPLWQQVIDWLFINYKFIIYYGTDDWSLVTPNESFLYNNLPNSSVYEKWEQAILKAIELIKEN